MCRPKWRRTIHLMVSCWVTWKTIKAKFPRTALGARMYRFRAVLTWYIYTHVAITYMFLM
jgi:hypothetical protein